MNGGLFIFLYVEYFMHGRAQKDISEWFEGSRATVYRPLFNCDSVCPVNCRERDVVLAFTQISILQDDVENIHDGKTYKKTQKLTCQHILTLHLSPENKVLQHIKC